jgi:hypothetical protein
VLINKYLDCNLNIVPICRWMQRGFHGRKSFKYKCNLLIRSTVKYVSLMPTEVSSSTQFKMSALDVTDGQPHAPSVVTDHTRR